MKESMRGFLRKLRYAIFVRLKPVFFRLLRILNPDYQVENFGASGAGTVTVDVPRLAAVAVSAPVVLNSDRSRITREVQWFMLVGMGCSTVEAEHFLNDVVGASDELTAEEFSEKLETWLQKKVQSTGDAPSFELFAKFLKHKQNVLENQRAYSVTGRESPSAVFWPDPTDTTNNRSLYSELPWCKAHKIIDRTTRIVSAGSCFATEIAHYLMANGFNYLVTEGNGGPDASYEVLGMGELPNASAAWGILFNTPSFRQLVERAFAYRQLPKVLWSQQYKGEELYFDPFRENVAFRSIEAYASNYDEHTQAIRQALSEMDVFIITLGLNEVWSFTADDSVFSRSPWRIAPSLVRRRVMTVEENVSDLMRMTELLRYVNPNVKIICTVSPVPLHATFRGDDQHVVVANAHSKAVLRVAAEEFVRRCPGAYYFPSYEIVTTCTEHPWEPDQRHVSRAAVANVMAAFVEMYVR